MCFGSKCAVETACDADNNLTTNNLEDALKNVQADCQRRQRDKGCNAMAREDAIIDLQHVEGASQRENVNDARYESKSGHDRCQLTQGFAYLIRLTGLRHNTAPEFEQKTKFRSLFWFMS